MKNAKGFFLRDLGDLLFLYVGCRAGGHFFLAQSEKKLRPFHLAGRQ
jgi:hypothetical protein